MGVRKKGAISTTSNKSIKDLGMRLVQGTPPFSSMLLHL